MGWLSKNEESSYLRVLGRASLLWGSKRDTVKDYLRDIEAGGLIEIHEEEDTIVWLGN